MTENNLIFVKSVKILILYCFFVVLLLIIDENNIIFASVLKSLLFIIKTKKMRNLKDYKDTVYRIIGAAMTVHRELSWGLMEAVYQEALHMELLDSGIENEMEKLINCYYKNRLMDKQYRMDMVVGDIVVELKSVKELLPVHRAQLFNYLRLTKKPIGLLINFGNTSLQGERYAFIESENECVMLDRNMNMLVREEDAYDDNDEW